MKKIFISIFTFLFLMMNVSALDLVRDTNGLLPVSTETYNNNIITFDGTNVASNDNIDVLRNTIFSTPQKTLITTSIANQDNITHTFKYFANSIMGGVIFKNIEVNLTPNSQVDFAVLTTLKNEQVDIFFKCLDCVNNSNGNYAYNYQIIDEKQTGTTSEITTIFVGAMTDLVDINIGFWKLIYYLFIFSIIIGGLGLLVNFAFKLYDWADRTSEKKKEIFSGGHHKAKRDN